MEFKLKNHREFMSQSTKDWYKTRKKNWFFVSKVPTLCWILTWALEIFKFPLWLVPFGQSIKHFTKKTPEELSFMTLISDANFGEELTCSFKIDMRNLTLFDPSTRKSQKIILMGFFWPKNIMLELKKYRGVLFDRTEDWCKIWRKTDLCFQKWHEELSKFSQAEK